MTDKRKKTEVYAFPAVFTIDSSDDNAVLVRFPDMDNCFADGDTVGEALIEAREALGNVLYWMEKDGLEIPTPSDIRDIKPEDGSFVSLIEANMPEVRKSWDTRSVSRTVTLPAWLDSKAKTAQVNFSQELQKALLKLLKVNAKVA